MLLLSLPLVTVLCILQISSGNPSSQLPRVSEVAQLCLTLCDPMDYSLPGSSVYGMFQEIILELVAISFSRGSFRARDWTQVSCIAGRLFIIWAIWETLNRPENPVKCSQCCIALSPAYNYTFLTWFLNCCLYPPNQLWDAGWQGPV